MFQIADMKEKYVRERTMPIKGFIWFGACLSMIAANLFSANLALRDARIMFLFFLLLLFNSTKIGIHIHFLARACFFFFPLKKGSSLCDASSANRFLSGTNFPTQNNRRVFFYIEIKHIVFVIKIFRCLFVCYIGSTGLQPRHVVLLSADWFNII